MSFVSTPVRSRSRLNSSVSGTCLAIAALLASLPASAQAQETDTESKVDPKDVIVVTGTLVRGIAPPGASVIGMTQEDIASSGATSVAQVLETIPQLGSFGTLQQPLAISAEVAVNRPNLRSLPGFNTAGGSTTLVMLDGHRFVGMGVASTTPDPDVIPPGVIERVEIVPDGGSAIYGSDAVAGVMNFITIKRFDGVKADASYGFADDYYAWDANVTAGKDWGSGSFFVSYNYAKTDQLLGKDRDYIREYPGTASGYTTLQCAPGNIEALAGQYGVPAGTVVGLPAGTATGPNQCDVSDYSTVYPESQRHSVFAGLTQKLDDSTSIEIRAFYTNRKTQSQSGPYRYSQIIAPAQLLSSLQRRGIPAISSPYSPFNFNFSCLCFRPASANSIDLVQQADFQFGDNDAVQSKISLETWGVTPTLTKNLDGNFQLRILGSYGESSTSLVTDAINEPAMRNAITAGLFNPYDPTSSNPAAVDAITDYIDFGRSKQNFADLRAIIDGDLFTLPGGAVKIAAGLEYYHEGFVTRRGLAVPGYEATGYDGLSIGGTLVAPAMDPVPRFSLGRHVTSAFGELVVPIVGEGNAMGGIQSLTVSAAGRYDKYNDIGDTFNPRLGLTWKPVQWVSVHGAWGKSFNAPSLADSDKASVDTLFVLAGASASYFSPPASLQASNGGPYPDYSQGLIVALRGNSPDIKPQKATTWSLGIDIQPPVIPGLNLGVNYYNIAFKNFIGVPPFETPSLIWQNYGQIITVNPSQAVLDAAYASADIVNGGNGSVPQASAVYAFFDARKRNLGNYKLDGLDFNASYRTATGFGSLFFNTSGTYELHRKQSSAAGEPYIELLGANYNRFRARSSIGTDVGSFTAQATWNYLQGYDLDPVVGYVEQDHVGSFSTIDLFFRYEFGGTGLTKDFALTLNVNNVFDQDPPVYRGGNSIGGRQGYANGATLGRFVKLGVSKKF